MLTTTWRTIPGFSRYEVSTSGVIRRKDNRRPLRPFVDPKALRHSYCLRSDAGGQGTVHVGRAMALAFLGVPDDDKLEACHNDGCAWNDSVENLRWDTHASNMADRWHHGTMATTKLNEDQVREIRSRYAQGESQTKLAQEFGVTSANVFYIVNRRTWRHI